MHLPIRFGLLPDEHALGSIARYKLIAGIQSERSFKQLLNIPQGAFKAQDIFNNSTEFCLQFLPTIVTITKNELLRKHLIWPLWQLSADPALLNSSERQTAIQPTNDNFLSYSKSWNLCKECVANDIVVHGIDYWHTSHQLPSCTICEIHQSPLFSASSLSTLSLKKLPSGYVSDPALVPLKGGIKNVEWSQYVYSIFRFLQNNVITKHDVLDLIKQKLSLPNKITSRHKVEINASLSELDKYYGEDFLKEIFSYYNVNNYQYGKNINIIWTILNRKTTNQYQPIYFLIIAKYLNIGVNELHLLSKNISTK